MLTRCKNVYVPRVKRCAFYVSL